MDLVKLVSGNSVYSFSAKESLAASADLAFCSFSRFFSSFFSRLESFRLNLFSSDFPKPGNWKGGPNDV